jgi:hypothetical protein
MRPLWQCPNCAREFANRNQSHACGTFTLEHHFAGKPDRIRAIFDTFVRAVNEDGAVRILPEKTRIAFQIRMSFAQLTPRKSWVDGHFVLARRIEHPRFRSIQSISERNHVHMFRLTSTADVDAELRDWIREARAVGAQEHLRHR